MKDRQHNGQMENDKRTNNDLQSISHDMVGEVLNRLRFTKIKHSTCIAECP